MKVDDDNGGRVKKRKRKRSRRSGLRCVRKRIGRMQMRDGVKRQRKKGLKAGFSVIRNLLPVSSNRIMVKFR